MSNKANETANQNLANGNTPEGNENPKGVETVKKENIFKRAGKCVINVFTTFPNKHPHITEFVTFVSAMAAGAAAMVVTMDGVTEIKRKRYATMQTIKNDPVVTAIPTQESIAIPEQPVSDLDVHEELASAAEVIDNVDTTTF